MHRYRSHTCGALRESDIGQTARLSGWCHIIRDLGGVLFIDLRDHYGITQCVVDADSPAYRDAEKLRSEWVVRMDGKVRIRPEGTANAELPTGQIEVYVTISRCSDPRLCCHCRSPVTKNILRTSVLSIASSTCVARGCTRTS